MTDRYHSIVVVLEKDMREDDAEYTLNAIRMIKGVLSVKQRISNPDTHMAEERAKREYANKLTHVLYPKTRL